MHTPHASFRTEGTPSTGGAGRRLSFLLSTLLCTGCATHSYEAQPLREQETLRRVDEERADWSAGELTLSAATDRMRTHCPRVLEVLAQYDSALRLSQVETPWPNPTFAAGPEFGWGDAVQTRRVQPFADLVVRIPLGDRLEVQDAVHLAQAQQARAEALATFRELYLELRGRYLALAVAGESEALQRERLEAARKSLAITTRLLEAGVATALDITFLHLEEAQERSEVLAAERATLDARARLAELISVGVDQLPPAREDELPATPDTPPDFDELKQVLIAEHPDLLRLKAEYEVAEQALRLEVAEQVPDLLLGGALKGETGERKTTFGLLLGMDLPLFDRNQQGIARAEGEREAVRVRYEAAVRRAVGELEHVHRALTLAVREREVLREAVLPAAEANLDVAHRSLEAGVVGALQVLDADRALRQARRRLLEARLGEQEAWARLESAVGYPLLEFASEEWEDVGRPPESLAEVREGEEASR